MFPPPAGSDEEAWRASSWTGRDVDSVLPMMLGMTPPGTDGFDQVQRIGAWEKVIAWAHARQYAEITRYVAESTATPPHGMGAQQAGESAQAEVGLILTLTPGGAAWRVSDARTLVEDFPATFAALETGAITLFKARIITEGCADVNPQTAAAVQNRVLPRAPRQTHGQLRAAVARAILREDAAAAERRRRRKQRERAVVLYPERDGMATLAATLPAVEAVGVYAVLDQLARACGGADERSMDARRADALTDLVLGVAGFCSNATNPAGTDTPSPGHPADTADAGTVPDQAARPHTSTGSDHETVAVPADSDVTGSDVATAAWSSDPATDPAAHASSANHDNPTAAPITPEPITPGPTRPPRIAPERATHTGSTNVSIQIRVIVPLDALRGDSDEPAELAGYGPITAAQARELAADPSSTWRRLVTDPLSGAILDYGTTRYRPPPEMAERVITRSQYCQFPGCRVPAHRCDLDHNEPFDPVNDTGHTSDANLGPKCRPHHRLKGMRGWSVFQYEDGSIEWITPTGHRYHVEPPPLTEPRMPVTNDEPPPF